MRGFSTNSSAKKFGELSLEDSSPLANSTTTTVLSYSAQYLYQALLSPAEDALFDAQIMVCKTGNAFFGYADVYRVVGYLTNSAGAFDAAFVQQVFHWDIPIATLGYSNYVTAVTVDVSGGNLRVRVTGNSTASEAKASAWVTLRAM